MASTVFRGISVPSAQKHLILSLSAIVLISILSTTYGQQLETKHEEFREESYLRRKLLRDGVIPDIISKPTAHVPEFIFYTGAMADYGNKVNPEHVIEAPRVVRIAGEPEDLFTILMTDYDAPSRSTPDQREWLHWAMGNCGAQNPLEGDTIAPFLPINPQRATGIHRFVFYVFKQPNNVQIAFKEKFSNRSEAGRKNFRTKDFANKYELGNIYGINYFLSEWIPEENREPFIHEPVSSS